LVSPKASKPDGPKASKPDGRITDGDHAVLVLDDDHSMLRGVERLLASSGFRVRTFSEADDFFRAGRPDVPACLILDNQLNDGMTGPMVHAEMQRRGWDMPTVFLTAHWNVQSVVHAMRAGADAFLTKPFDPAELVSAVAQALEHARTRCAEASLMADARARATSLTVREAQIVKLVVSGRINKEIADELNLAVVTVKVHRGRAMRKLGVGNPAALAQIAALAGLLD
jgi:FixJ family two-component response regulator